MSAALGDEAFGKLCDAVEPSLLEYERHERTPLHADARDGDAGFAVIRQCAAGVHVLLHGPAGVGKRTMLRALCHRARTGHRALVRDVDLLDLLAKSPSDAARKLNAAFSAAARDEDHDPEQRRRPVLVFLDEMQLLCVGDESNYQQNETRIGSLIGCLVSCLRRAGSCSVVAVAAVRDIRRLPSVLRSHGTFELLVGVRAQTVSERQSLLRAMASTGRSARTVPISLSICGDEVVTCDVLGQGHAAEERQARATAAATGAATGAATASEAVTVAAAAVTVGTAGAIAASESQLLTVDEAQMGDTYGGTRSVDETGHANSRCRSGEADEVFQMLGERTGGYCARTPASPCLLADMKNSQETVAAIKASFTMLTCMLESDEAPKSPLRIRDLQRLVSTTHFYFAMRTRGDTRTKTADKEADGSMDPDLGIGAHTRTRASNSTHATSSDAATCGCAAAVASDCCDADARCQGRETRMQWTMKDAEHALEHVRASGLARTSNGSELPHTPWAEIGGYLDLRDRLLRSIDSSNKRADALRRLGMSPPSGALLFGPPGNGKTLMAKAAASNSGIASLFVKATSFFGEYVGDTEAAIRDLFQQARDVAPSIIVIDEVDAVGATRNSDAHSSQATVSERALSTLLNELDGVGDRGGVFVLGCTSQPEALDSALLRPGRLELLLPVLAPDEESRRAVLAVHSWKLRLSPTVDLDDVARRTERFSCAALAAVCREAAMCALTRHMAQRELLDSARDLQEQEGELRTQPGINLGPQPKRDAELLGSGGDAVVQDAGEIRAGDEQTRPNPEPISQQAHRCDAQQPRPDEKLNKFHVNDRASPVQRTGFSSAGRQLPSLATVTDAPLGCESGGARASGASVEVRRADFEHALQQVAARQRPSQEKHDAMVLRQQAFERGDMALARRLAAQASA